MVSRGRESRGSPTFPRCAASEKRPPSMVSAVKAGAGLLDSVRGAAEAGADFWPPFLVSRNAPAATMPATSSALAPSSSLRRRLRCASVCPARRRLPIRVPVPPAYFWECAQWCWERAALPAERRTRPTTGSGSRTPCFLDKRFPNPALLGLAGEASFRGKDAARESVASALVSAWLDIDAPDAHGR